MPHLFVDGFNVIQAWITRGRDRDGWWRAPHREALIGLLDEAGMDCVVVFDGDTPGVSQRGNVVVRFAHDADDWLVAQARPDDLVVTRDRRLVNRLHTRGVAARSPGWLEAQVTEARVKGARRSR